MKMIVAIIRPEKLEEVQDALDAENFSILRYVYGRLLAISSSG